MDEEQQKKREDVAKEYGFSLPRNYCEKYTASILDVDLSTLKRWRRAGKTPFINMGERHIRYRGYDIADMLLNGTANG